MRSYSVKNVRWTIWGDGVLAGRACVSVAFAGCGMWDGRASGRGAGKAACAEWCDADFVRGAPLHGFELLRDIEEAAGDRRDRMAGQPLVYLTGGEPLLQVDQLLVDLLWAHGWDIAIETSGAVFAPAALIERVSHLCVAPSLGVVLKIFSAHELRVVLPGAGGAFPRGWTPALLHELEKSGTWLAKYVQPLDPLLSGQPGDTVLAFGANHPKAEENYQQNVLMCTEWVRENPEWRLSMQVQKYAGIG